MQYDRRNKYKSVNSCISIVIFVTGFPFLNLDCVQTATGLKSLNFMTPNLNSFSNKL